MGYRLLGQNIYFIVMSILWCCIFRRQNIWVQELRSEKVDVVLFIIFFRVLFGECVVIILDIVSLEVLIFTEENFLYFLNFEVWLLFGQFRFVVLRDSR